MTSAPYQIEIARPLAEAALRDAASVGKSLEQWVNSMLEERIILQQHAEAFFQERARGATGDAWRSILQSVPDRPADPGDGFED